MSDLSFYSDTAGNHEQQIQNHQLAKNLKKLFLSVPWHNCMYTKTINNFFMITLTSGLKRLRENISLEKVKIH